MDFSELSWKEASALVEEAQGQPKLQMEVRRENGYVTCDCYPVYEHPDGAEIQSYPSGHEFQGLQVHCQGNVGEDRTYAWEVQYRAFRVDLADAERMVKTLRKVKRSMERMEENEGSCRTFGQYVNRVMRALKIKEGMTDRSWRYTAGDFVDVVDGAIFRKLKRE